MNLFIKMISKLRYQWKVRVKRMTQVDNKMLVFSLKNDIYIYHRCLFKKKDIGKRMKNEGCQKVLNQCYLQCYEYPVTCLCTHSTNYFGFPIFEKIMIYHNIIIHCIIVVKITLVTILLIWNKYNSIKKLFFLKCNMPFAYTCNKVYIAKEKKNTPHIFTACIIAWRKLLLRKE